MIYTLKGEWDRQGVENVLGPPSPRWPWETAPVQETNICGLVNVPTDSAGWGDMAACCRVHIHPDGVCVHSSPGPFAAVFGTEEADARYAEAIYTKLRAAREDALKGAVVP